MSKKEKIERERKRIEREIPFWESRADFVRSLLAANITHTNTYENERWLQNILLRIEQLREELKNL